MGHSVKIYLQVDYSSLPAKSIAYNFLKQESFSPESMGRGGGEVQNCHIVFITLHYKMSPVCKSSVVAIHVLLVQCYLLAGLPAR